ncbi:MAG: serine/threonine protein kinase/WD40 repeat protein [Planctomycetota bacterium]
MAKKPEPDLVSDPVHAGKSESSRNHDLQQAIEVYVGLHSAGKAPDAAKFAEQYPQDMRAEILSQVREFMMFDGLLGRQEWQEPEAEDEEGRAFGEFLILEELGRGGMGVVYLAKQKSLDRRVALKVMASGLTLSKRHVERFRREAMATAQLSHRAIVPVHSLVEVDGAFALAMDYVAGRNLADMLDDLRLANREGEGVAIGTLGLASEKGYVAECAMLVAEVASALAVAHQNQVVHRDLKPRNLMIDDRRQVRLLDFGLAKSLDATRESLSMSGEITGTAHYMSPEQTLAKRVEVDHRADIWSLGVILYEILTLTRPFDGKNLQQIVYEICFKEPVPLSRRNTKVPRDLVTICQKALEKDPGKRYQTAAEFEADLQRFLRWEPVHAKPASTWTRATKFVRRHRTESAFAALALIAAIVVVTFLWTRNAINARDADALLLRAEARAQAGDYQMAIDLTDQALVLRNDDATRERLGRYNADTQLVATVVAMKVTKSQQQLGHNRKEALRLALEANSQRPSAMTRSAVLEALGTGSDVHMLPTQQRTIEGCWSPSGEHLAIGGNNGSLLFFRSDDDTRPRALIGHATTTPVAGVGFANDNRIVSVGADNTLRFWQPIHGNTPQTVQLPGAGSTLNLSLDGTRALVTTSQPPPAGPQPNSTYPLSAAQVWNTSDGTPVSAPIPHHSMILATAISPDGSIVATYVGGRTGARLWRTDDGSLIAACAKLGRNGTSSLPQIAFSHDSTVCAIGTENGSVSLYATDDGSLLDTVYHSGAITSMAFDPSSLRLLTGSRDETARIWDIRRTPNQGEAPRVEIRETGILRNNGPVLNVVFDATGQLAATATDQSDGAIRIFDVGSSRPSSDPIHSYEVGRAVKFLRFAPDSRRILGLAGKQALVWDFGKSHGVVTLSQPGKVPSVTFASDGRRLATAGDDEILRLWHSRDGRQVWATDPLGNPLEALSIDANDQHIACSDVGGSVHVLAMQDGKKQFTLAGKHHKVRAVSFFDNGRQLLTAGSPPDAPEKGRIVVWNVADQSEQQSLTRDRDITSAAVNAAGTMLVTVERGEHFARLWSLPELQSRGKVGENDHSDTLNDVRFAPNGNTIVTASSDTTACVFHLNGERVATIEVGSIVRFAAFAKDGQQLLTGSIGKGGTAQLWRIDDASEVLHFIGHRGSLLWGSLNDTGALAATSAQDGATCVWPTDPVAVASRLPSQSANSAATTKPR